MAQKVSPPPVDMRRGILHLNGEPHFLVSGEYPYYRDDPTQWADRLAKLQHGGIETVTCAIPWRHHAIKNTEPSSIVQITYDFTGETHPSRNLAQFLTLVRDMGMTACLTIGPFTDPTLTYGGMPDFVNPLKNTHITSYRNHLVLRGHKERSRNRWKPLYGTPLPSPTDPLFLRYLTEFLGELATNILYPLTYPDGPIVLLQLGYQGYFAEGKAPHWVIGDYSLRNLQGFWSFLQMKYSTLDNFNQVHHTTATEWSKIAPPVIYPGNRHITSIQDLWILQDWVNFQTEQYIGWIKTLQFALQGPFKSPKSGKKEMKNFPPVILQWESPVGGRMGLDVWLSRVKQSRITQETGLQFGYTNWAKAENFHSASNFCHSVTPKLQSGINRAVNWGVRKQTSAKFEYAFTSLYQTLLTCANGSTGYTMTPVIGTAVWSRDLDDRHLPPYPTHAAIDDHGISGNKFQLMAGLNKYFGEYYGSEFLETKQETLLALGIYTPYATLAAYAGHDPKLWKRLNIPNP
ncbi:MAG: beta-galactosidase, partial [Promethearchaeota archaeon]